MMIDFALVAERRDGLSAEEEIRSCAPMPPAFPGRS